MGTLFLGNDRPGRHAKRLGSVVKLRGDGMHAVVRRTILTAAVALEARKGEHMLTAIAFHRPACDCPRLAEASSRRFRHANTLTFAQTVRIAGREFRFT